MPTLNEYDLLELRGVPPNEQVTVLDSGDPSEHARLEAVRDALAAQAVADGFTKSQKRYGVRPTTRTA